MLPRNARLAPIPVKEADIGSMPANWHFADVTAVDATLSQLSSDTRAVLEEALRLGASLHEVVVWSKAAVAHMASPHG